VAGRIVWSFRDTSRRKNTFYCPVDMLIAWQSRVVERATLIDQVLHKHASCDDPDDRYDDTEVYRCWQYGSH
jgi:hypothetical protein